MERLTFYDDFGEPAYRCDGAVYVNEVSRRLAAYEDTGLTPEGINGMKTAIDIYQNAAAEGRLIALPCKVGDLVYKLSGKNKKILPIKIKWFETNNEGWFACGNYLPRAKAYYLRSADLGKTWFTTCEEAEAALKGE